MPLSTGQILKDRYRVVRLLGQGGFGAVYRAWDTTFDIPCALKENLDRSPKAQRQFLREARMLHTLRHPHLPQVTDYFSIPDQGQYLVMDYIEGQDLHEALQEAFDPLPEAQALEWIAGVCSALAYLHSQEPPVIHRDIKPANIKITPQGKAVLVDFGIAKTYDPERATTYGARAVTPGFSPPEQYGQGKTDARSDIYALGATCYALLAGYSPPDSVDLLMGREAQPPPLTEVNPAVSAQTSAAIAKAMRLEAAERFATVEAFQAGLAGRLDAAHDPARVAPQTAAQTAPQIAQPAAASARAAEPAGDPSPAAATPAAARPLTEVAGRGRPWVWIGALVAVLIVAALLFFVFFRRGRQPGSAVQATPAFAEQMALIPAGAFQMGSRAGEEDERPAHTVFLDAYRIDLYEATNAQFAEFLNATGAPPGENRRWQPDDSGLARIAYSGGVWEAEANFAGHPVTAVSWRGALAFCRWRGARLPSEAEWEKAARGGLEGMRYPWGDEEPRCQPGAANGANFDDDADCDDRGTVAVGTYAPNGYGLFDMAGNVWEWVADWYAPDFYTRSPAENPTGPDAGEARVLRGGSWAYDLEALRVSTRLKDPPDGSNDEFGFRCARSAE